MSRATTCISYRQTAPVGGISCSAVGKICACRFSVRAKTTSSCLKRKIFSRSTCVEIRRQILRKQKEKRNEHTGCEPGPANWRRIVGEESGSAGSRIRLRNTGSKDRQGFRYGLGFQDPNHCLPA